MDWDGDPELRRLRREFLESLAARAEELDRVATGLLTVTSKDTVAPLIARLEHVSHRLAGVAGSYGFPDLTRLAEQVEARCAGLWTPAEAAQAAEGLAREVRAAARQR